ncbi:L-PSP endoribonuclease family protein [Aspergillus arachidicola]|uniref:L-PSP endoribonuclease family protein n=1 Tax=Aspergillus arachidicola TaxID=656916 RepID=A0A2G7FIE2_9EURO|nr:L-PSP endoribonuclease family protein [Aspergillus arachidicola]
MSHLTYYNYPGVGERNRQNFRYSQASASATALNAPAKVGIKGGWDPKTGEFYKEINAQIDQAFANVDLALKTAGGKGWAQVYRVNSYHVPINNEALEAMVRNFRKWMPDHEPLWTCVGVTRLGEDDMRVEIEVVAHDPK